MGLKNVLFDEAPSLVHEAKGVVACTEIFLCAIFENIKSLFQVNTCAKTIVVHCSYHMIAVQILVIHGNVEIFESLLIVNFLTVQAK